MSYEITEMSHSEFLRKSITRCIERYFDKHWTFYMEELLNTPSEELQAVLEERLAEVLDDQGDLFCSIDGTEVPGLGEIIRAYIDVEALAKHYAELVRGAKQVKESDEEEYERWVNRRSR